jgi:iron complex outermembrane recepter protein
MSRTPIALLAGRVALLVAAVAVSMGAPAQDDSTESPAQGVTADETESAEETAPSSHEAAAGAEPQQSSDTAAAADQPPPDQPQADEPQAQEGQPELEAIPVAEEPVPAIPVTASGSARLDDLVVTAQKRQQGTMDVPISMSVITDEFIKAQGLTSLAEALQFVPNFKIVEYLNTVRPQCRGFTVSQGNAAFEPPCGLALDGIAYARSAYFSAGLFDLQRIEVLRGPQGTTFGKNTTAGVIALNTKDPTDAFVGNVDLQYAPSGAGAESGNGLKRAEVGFGGPLIRDVVNFRIAAAQDDREGHMENTYHQTDPSVRKFIGGLERSQYRAKLQFPDVLGAEIKLLTEKTRVTPHGVAAKLVDVSDSLAEYFRQYDPNVDFERNWKGSGLEGGYNDTILTRHHGEASSDIGGWSVALLGATGKLDNNFFIDASFVPQRWVDLIQTEANPFTTAEVHAFSPDFEGVFGLKDLFGLDLGRSSMLVGVFGQRTGLDVTTFTLLRYAVLPGIVAAQNGGTVINDKPAYDAGWEQERQTGSQPSEWLYLVNHQTTQTTAVFAQFSWYLTEKWNLDLGARLSTEKKTADWDVSYSDPAPLFNPPGTRQFSASRGRSEDSFQPKVSIGYKPTDRINLFAHWAVAHKGGGFNFSTPTGNPEEPDPSRSNEQTGHLSFGPEQGTDWGFDVKSILLDNTLRLNLSLFRLTVDDFQVLTDVPGTRIEGTTRLPNGFKEVINVGRARAQGVEIDTQYVPTDWLTVIGALGYNDTEYLSAPLDTCGFNIEEQNADPETGRCDHTGFAFLGTPKLAGTLTLDGHFPLAGLWGGFGDLMFLLGGTVEYTGTQYTSAYDPRNSQPAYFLYRAQTGVSSPTWSFRVTGLNLANDYISLNTGWSPSSTSVAPLPPRTLFAQFSWNYW